MGNELITRDQLQSDLENLYNNKISPYLNGTTHTGFTPVGTVISYFGETAPAHYLICDGATYNKSDYPELWTHLSSLTDTAPYVVDGDNTKFKVPDLRGEFLRGTGTNGHTDQGSGANVGVHQDATEANMIFTEAADGNTYYRMANRSFGENSDGGYGNSGSLGAYRMLSSGSLIDWTNQPGATYKVRPTNTSVLYCIAYKNIYIDLALDSFPLGISNPTDGQALVWNGTEGRWKNAGILHEYSTDEHVVGKWIDGRPIYEKTIVLSTSFTFVKTTSWTKFIDFPDIQLVIDVKCYDNGNSLKLPPALFYAHSDKIDYFCSFNDMASWFVANTVTIRYTKTTDTPTV